MQFAKQQGEGGFSRGYGNSSVILSSLLHPVGRTGPPASAWESGVLNDCFGLLDLTTLQNLVELDEGGHELLSE